VPAPALFRPENELEEALLVAVRDGDRAGLLAALAVGELYLPAAGRPQEGAVPVESGDELELPFLEHQNERYVPAFTSVTELLRFLPAGTAYLRIEGRLLASAWPAGSSLALNPGGRLGVVIPAADVARLRTPSLRPPEPWLVVGEPAEEPVELLSAIRAFAEAEPAVRAAYRAAVLRRGAARSEPVVGLELEDGADVERLLGAAAAAAQEAGVEAVALQPLVPGGDAVSRFLLSRTEPFYVRFPDPVTFFRVEPEVAGRLGPKTIIDRRDHPPRVDKLHYVFEGWLGDELLESFPCFVVTADAAARLEAARLAGFELRPVEIGTSESFDELHPDRTLPDFRWLDVGGTARRDDFGVDDDGMLVVSKRALDVLRAGQLEHADIAPA
jgi:hypothetical protein